MRVPVSGSSRAQARGRQRCGHSLREPARARPRACRTSRRTAGARSARAAPVRRDAARRSRETCTCRSGCSRTRTPAAPAWSRWMWLSRRWRTSVRARPCARGLPSGRRRRRRAAVEERRPAVGVDDVRRDRPLVAAVQEVDRLQAHARARAADRSCAPRRVASRAPTPCRDDRVDKQCSIGDELGGSRRRRARRRVDGCAPGPSRRSLERNDVDADAIRRGAHRSDERVEGLERGHVVRLAELDEASSTGTRSQ